MSAEPDNVYTSFFSEVLGCQVDVEVFGELNSVSCILFCLDDLFFTGLLRDFDLPSGLARLSLKGGFISENSYHLSLATLECFSDFLANDLIGFVCSLLENDELRFFLAGAGSLGVLGVFAASQYRDRFCGVLSVGGAFWWKPGFNREWGWLARFLAVSGECGGRVGLLCHEREGFERPPGVLTDGLAHRHLRDVLIAKKCEVKMLELPAEENSNEFTNREVLELVVWVLD